MVQPVSCFLRGTKLRTIKGDIPVEKISIGDLLLTERGAHLPVKWIGRRCFKKAPDATWPEDFIPVRIARFALDHQTPHTDLYLSPNHALFMDGALIPARHLINNASIAAATPDRLQQIEYFHIEFETHEVIFAEGAAVETFMATNGREIFDNFVEYERRYGHEKQKAMVPYAPYASYNGRRSELMALLRRATSTIVDVRDPVQVAFDRTAARARQLIS